MWSPTIKLERWALKPGVFLLCLMPSIALLLGLIQSKLGFNPVEVLTHQTGLWALRFLLITLLITPLRSLTGMIWLTRFRRMFGLFAFYYVILHFSVYFLWDQSLNLRYIFEDIIDRPYITVGFLALCLMIPLAITSFNRIRRRMGRKWNLLHRLTYLIAALAVLHYIWLTRADYLEPGVYAAVFVGLMTLRLRGWLALISLRTKK